MNTTFYRDDHAEREERRRLTRIDTERLADYQLQRFNTLLASILPINQFYREKLGTDHLRLDSLQQFAELPFSFKDELADGQKGFPANLTFPVDQYLRLHRTSGTRGRPLVVADTADDWNWWIKTWQYVLDAAEITSQDRCLLAFSFGPFIGFWSAFDAIIARNAMAIPTGGMGTVARLEMLRSTGATAMFCTPSYALHLAEVADENQIEVADLAVRRIVVAGEPGGSVPSIREKIESFWKAKVVDHGGASEVGPWGVSDPAGKGMYVIESEFIAEFLSVESGQPADEGELSELVLTSLGRTGCPVIRYRTGDLVRPTWNDDQPCRFVLLQGGVLGRTDDMMVIRGVNIFPTSIEQILRSFPEVVEYRMTVLKHGALDHLLIEVEDRMNDPKRIQNELRLRLGLRVDVNAVAMGSLPRFEGKGKRFVDQR